MLVFYSLWSQFLQKTDRMRIHQKPRRKEGQILIMKTVRISYNHYLWLNIIEVNISFVKYVYSSCIQLTEVQVNGWLKFFLQFLELFMFVYMSLLKVWNFLPYILIVNDTDGIHEVTSTMVVNSGTEMGVYYNVKDTINQNTNTVEHTEWNKRNEENRPGI